MKLKFLATGWAPDYYSFEGDRLTAYYKDKEETVDFGFFEHGDSIDDLEMEDIELDGFLVVREAERTADGELYLKLCQKAGNGHWRENDGWVDSATYDKDKLYIKEVADGQVKY